LSIEQIYKHALVILLDPPKLARESGQLKADFMAVERLQRLESFPLNETRRKDPEDYVLYSERHIPPTIVPNVEPRYWPSANRIYCVGPKNDLPPPLRFRKEELSRLIDEERGECDEFLRLHPEILA
jgi:hypothetical protein